MKANKILSKVVGIEKSDIERTTLIYKEGSREKDKLTQLTTLLESFV